MQIFDTALADVKIVRSTVHADDRGWFAESFNAGEFARCGLPSVWAQDNQSFSRRGVLRGLHYQMQQPQGKLVRVLTGEIWDVAVDLRRNSSQFGRWAGFSLRPRGVDGHLEMLWIPEGFAHGFVVVSETAEVLYKTTRGYFPSGERCIRWDDPELAIGWPVRAMEVVVSAKDAGGTSFRGADVF